MNQAEDKPPAALVVDDDEADLLYFQNSLQNQGFRVASAMTAEDAVRELSRGGWDVIILDWMLPQMTGIELLGKLKNNPSWRDIPVILVTAKAGSGALDKGLTAGARDYIRKPVDRTELMARVRAAISNKRILEKLENSNQELMRLCQMKDEFLSMVSHDVRAPLNSIVGFSDFLLEGKMGDLNEKQQRMIEVIKKSARAQLSLVENLLEVARLNSGRINLKLRKADLSGIAQECWEGLKPNADKKNIEFVFTAASQAAMVMVDDMRICQVVNNLITNAIKFTPRGGRVEVSVLLADNGPTLSVKDNGPGVPEEERSRLFNRFEQTRIKSTSGESGFGLGLAIVKNIVEMHNGNVWLESRFGEGAEFFVCLPSAEQMAPR